MPFSVFLSLLLVLSCHQPLAFGSGTSRAQPEVGLATRSLDSTLATTFNYNNGDEVGAVGNKHVFSLWAADLVVNLLQTDLYQAARLSAGLSRCHMTRKLCTINV